MRPPIPERIRSIQDPVVPIIAALIQRYPGTISLGQGVVHYGPPTGVAEATAAFLQAPGSHLYTPDWGIPTLVDAIGSKVSRENHIDMAERAVVVTAGANMGFLNAMLAITDPGDEVVLLAPYYFNHEMAVRLAGCSPRVVPTDACLAPDLGAIEAVLNHRTRAVVTVSPNNPTGTTYSEGELRAVNDLCRRRGIFHISDEAYEHFVYAGASHFSPGAAVDSQQHTVALYSFSKSYGLASWRVGYMIIPAGLFDAVMKVQDTNVICAPAVSQYAALACLEEGSGYCREYIAEMSEVRGLVLDALSALGDAVSVPAANGAFYVYLRVNRPLDAFELSKRLIAEHGVAVIPGTAFGSGDACYLRVSYGALKPREVREGIGRLVTGLRAISEHCE